MNSLATYHQSLGATLADDGIPLHYGDLKGEYKNALNSAILLDRSHEGHILLTGDDRFELVNRMSTNKIVDMALHEGRATVFTNATGRLLFRVMTYNRPEGLLMITEPGQGDTIATFLNRNIFFGDKVKVMNLQRQTVQFALHGPTSSAVMEAINADLASLPDLFSAEIEYGSITFTIVRRKAIVEQHWVIICQSVDGVSVHQQVMSCGKAHGLKPAGSLTYNTLRIRSGRPAGRELSSNYIPLEVGLWDEISFNKGCYTGQEIIARMESRERLAKTIVKLDLSGFVTAPVTVYHNDKPVGTLTSSVEAPDGQYYALAVIKTDVAQQGTPLTVGDSRSNAIVASYAGQQPSFIHE